MSGAILPAGFAFSQASLQDYADCPRRFQLRYVLGVQWPAPRDESVVAMEERTLRGAAFHRLVHQHTVGIPRETLDRMAKEAEVESWWQSYLVHPPQGLPEAWRRSEVRLSVPISDYRLSARYDLLAIDPRQRAVIVDWKTVHRRPSRLFLEHRFQTLVYPFVLVEAGAHLNEGEPIAPEQVEILYWFDKTPQQVERFPYDRDQHRSTAQKLDKVIREITEIDLAEWSLTANVQRCAFCRYRTLCERERVEGAEEPFELDQDLDPFDLDFEQVAEIEF